MHYIILILLCVPFLSANGATPFLEAKYQPTLTLPRRTSFGPPFSIPSSLYSNNISLSTGVKFSRNEWYLSYMRGKSNIASNIESYTDYNSSGAETRYRFYEADRIRSARLTIGGRWHIAQNEFESVRAYLGAGIFLGHVAWEEEGNFTTRTHDEISGAPIDSTQFQFDEEDKSELTKGILVEMGFMFQTVKQLWVVTNAQLDVAYVPFALKGPTAAPTYDRIQGGYMFIEPSLGVGIRWEMR